MEKTLEQIEKDVLDMIRTCYDPEIPVNIYELGLIYEVNINEEHDVHVLMTLTSPSCPVAETLPPDVEEKIRSVDGVKSAKVEITFEPTWDQSMMSEEAKLELGFL
jgi:FeS assembly SUF system protein